jgi:hypothetical protein
MRTFKRWYLELEQDADEPFTPNTYLMHCAFYVVGIGDDGSRVVVKDARSLNPHVAAVDLPTTLVAELNQLRTDLAEQRETVIKLVELLAPEFGMDDLDCDRLVARLRELNKDEALLARLRELTKEK